MKTRDSFLGMALLCLTVAGCQCSSPPVKEHLKPEGMPCETDSECETGLCDALPGQSKLCIRKCTDGCLVNEVCEPLGTERYACVPDPAKLCEACTVDSDCPYPGDKCVQLGGALVCARDCSFDGSCPDSFQCGQAIDADESLLQSQCTPKSGTCECTAASDGQTVPCQSTNSYGTCQGVKTCSGQSGYSACNARTPTAEVCNGVDDDCNGQTDENLGETTCGTGECQVTVSNCANGEPQTCTPRAPTAEVCDDKDNDCDQQIDEDFDKQNDVNNCGSCGHVCSVPNASAVCAIGECGIGACNPGWWNANGDPSDGCEYMCSVTNGGVELCDGIDNDCDGAIDEGFDVSSDPLNCGLCGKACHVQNGNVNTYVCAATICGIGTCDPGYGDCDQQYSNGCEENTDTSLANCGGCNQPCTTPNATPVCDTGTCAIQQCDVGYADCNSQVPDGCEAEVTTDVQHCGSCGNTCSVPPNAAATCVAGICGYTCQPNYWDLDGNSSNGCEYTCTYQGADDPDDTFVDQNCDGIDGEISKAIFVSPDGDDNDPGTMAAPKKTITAAINVTNVSFTHIYVSVGTYDEPVVLKNGVSIYGGYSRAAGWARNAGNLVTVRSNVIASNPDRIVAVEGNAITSISVLDHLTIKALNTTALGTSTYGVHCSNCAGLVIRQCDVSAGSAGSGVNGVNGSSGAAGFNGGPGQPGTCDSNTVGAAGGSGGNSSCGRSGGHGGKGGDYGSHAGATGSQGVGGTPGGAGGSGGSTGNPGSTGGYGASGSTGGNGAGGSSGAIASGYWSGNGGASGGAGAGGNGGGGGGGGGGQGGTWVDDGNGNGGGGGGAGGCGGTGGSGGGAGGSSFGVFLIDSTGAVIDTCTISSGNGGNGGGGGAGGLGGAGGFGGAGGTACTGEVGAGGTGGHGGSGGRGGHGGGGAGGASYGLYKVNSTPTLSNATFTAGNGGLGGSSLGSDGTPGPAAGSN